MNIDLYLISKNSWDILSQRAITIQNTDSPVFLELLEAIYDLYPQFNPVTDFQLYWQSSPTHMLEIRDWISYSASLKLMADNSIYLLVNDVETFYGDTKRFLGDLDMEEAIEEQERNRSKYDVIIKRGCECEDIQDEKSHISEDDEDYSSNDILSYALRKDSIEKCFTADLILKYNVLHCIKKGWPKLKKKLTLLPDEVIERKIQKNAKGKGKGKNDKGKKGKK